jgi:hypothetical protein
VTYSSSLMTVGYTTDWEEHFGQAKSSAMIFRNSADLCDRSCKGANLKDVQMFRRGSRQGSPRFNALQQFATHCNKSMTPLGRHSAFPPFPLPNRLYGTLPLLFRRHRPGPSGPD